MASNVVKVWVGRNVYGELLDIAQRDDGVFFRRTPTYYGTAKKQGKWTPTTPAFTINEAGDMLVEYVTLTAMPTDKYRLPYDHVSQI